MLNRLAIEAGLQVRSRWTWVAAGALVSIVIVGAVSSASFIGSFAPTLQTMEAELGAEGFAAWLAADAEAEPFRADIRAVRGEMGPNLALAVTGAVGPLLAAVWGASVVGSEFARRTVRTRAAHVGWPHAVVAKCVLLAGGSLMAAAGSPPSAGFRCFIGSRWSALRRASESCSWVAASRITTVRGAGLAVAAAVSAAMASNPAPWIEDVRFMALRVW